MKITKKVLPRLVIAIFFILNSSCIHTPAQVNETVDLASSKQTDFQTNHAEKIKIESVVYSKDKWPLSDFFRNLTAGKIKKAARSVDLRYKPSNIDNHVLTELANDGFLPVYLKLKNESSEPIKISEKQFTITDGAETVKAIPSEQIPREFKRFNSTAILANIYNVSVITVGVLAVVVAISVAAHDHGSPGFYPNFPSLGGDTSGDIWNDTLQRTHINYKDYILADETIAPQQSIEKLLFFHVDAGASEYVLHFGYENK